MCWATEWVSFQARVPLLPFSQRCSTITRYLKLLSLWRAVGGRVSVLIKALLQACTVPLAMGMWPPPFCCSSPGCLCGLKTQFCSSPGTIVPSFSFPSAMIIHHSPRVSRFALPPHPPQIKAFVHIGYTRRGKRRARQGGVSCSSHVAVLSLPRTTA